MANTTGEAKRTSISGSIRYRLEEQFVMGHVRYINILTWLRGFRVKRLYLVLFSLYLSLFWELRDKRNLKNLQFWPESLGAMIEYWYIERGLLYWSYKYSFFIRIVRKWNDLQEHIVHAESLILRVHLNLSEYLLNQ